MTIPVDDNPTAPNAVLAPVGTRQTVRFAPSPSGYMHLGHAYSSLIAWHNAQASGSRFLLRIEDIETVGVEHIAGAIDQANRNEMIESRHDQGHAQTPDRKSVV